LDEPDVDVLRGTDFCDYPAEGTYADLLWWHMFVWGTRPDSGRAVWTSKELVAAVFGDDDDSEKHGRNLRNWLGRGSPPGYPSWLERIEDAFFDDSFLHERWRADLRLAHGRSRGKGKNNRTIGNSQIDPHHLDIDIARLVEAHLNPEQRALPTELLEERIRAILEAMRSSNL
jgi:hypothetical protein